MSSVLCLYLSSAHIDFLFILFWLIIVCLSGAFGFCRMFSTLSVLLFSWFYFASLWVTGLVLSFLIFRATCTCHVLDIICPMLCNHFAGNVLFFQLSDFGFMWFVCLSLVVKAFPMLVFSFSYRQTYYCVDRECYFLVWVRLNFAMINT